LKKNHKIQKSLKKMKKMKKNEKSNKEFEKEKTIKITKILEETTISMEKFRSNIFFQISNKYTTEKGKFDKIKQNLFKKLTTKKQKKLMDLQENKKNEYDSWEKREEFIAQTILYLKYIDPNSMKYSQEIIQFLEETTKSGNKMIEVIMTVYVMLNLLLNQNNNRVNNI